MSIPFQAIDAEGYQRVMGRFSKHMGPLLVSYAGHAGGERLLDVGCGTGSATAALAARDDHAAIVGVDVSRTYIDYATANNSDPRISFQVADARDLPFEDSSFDRAICQLVLQFIADPHLAVREMCRVVRPGGVVAACAWDSFGAFPPARIMWDVAVGLGVTDKPNLARPLSTVGELTNTWREAGLVDVVEDILTIRFEYVNFEDYWTSLENGDGPLQQFVAELSPGDRDAFKARMHIAYLSGSEDGHRSMLGGALACRGTVPGA